MLDLIMNIVCGSFTDSVIIVLWLIMFTVSFRMIYLFIQLERDHVNKALKGWRSLFPMFLFSDRYLSEEGRERRDELFKKFKLLGLLVIICLILLLIYTNICPIPP
jgi:hypothetical protein